MYYALVRANLHLFFTYMNERNSRGNPVARIVLAEPRHIRNGTLLGAGVGGGLEGDGLVNRV